MTQPTIRDRLRDPKIVGVYRNMIKNSPEQVVIELRANMKKQALNHPKQVELEQLFIERLGE